LSSAPYGRTHPRCDSVA